MPSVELFTKELIFVGPMSIRDSFELALIYRILFEDVAERTLEPVADATLFLFRLLASSTVLASMLGSIVG